ncbi:hypothetical protein ACNOYE_29585 [Nannocystaceae bacterium ST9]
MTAQTHILRLSQLAIRQVEFDRLFSKTWTSSSHVFLTAQNPTVKVRAGEISEILLYARPRARYIHLKRDYTCDEIARRTLGFMIEAYIEITKPAVAIPNGDVIRNAACAAVAWAIRQWDSNMYPLSLLPECKYPESLRSWVESGSLAEKLPDDDVSQEGEAPTPFDGRTSDAVGVGAAAVSLTLLSVIVGPPQRVSRSSQIGASYYIVEPELANTESEVLSPTPQEKLIPSSNFDSNHEGSISSPSTVNPDPQPEDIDIPVSDLQTSLESRPKPEKAPDLEMDPSGKRPESANTTDPNPGIKPTSAPATEREPHEDRGMPGNAPRPEQNSGSSDSDPRNSNVFYEVKIDNWDNTVKDAITATLNEGGDCILKDDSISVTISGAPGRPVVKKSRNGGDSDRAAKQLVLNSVVKQKTVRKLQCSRNQ